MSRHPSVGERFRANAAKSVRPPFVRSLELWAQRLSSTAKFWIILAVALAQGFLYLVAAPPWQHYDEPTHFEYAWLIADRNAFPQAGDENLAMRREVLNTLFATQFFQRVPSPALLDDNEVWLGITELGHPPLYYALISLPLRAVHHLDILTQMYVARAASTVLFALVVLICYGLMRDLLPSHHPLVWAVPLAVALIPSFADVMTSVNSDVGAVFFSSLFLWGAIRIIRIGPSIFNVVWVVSSCVLAVFTKNTAVITAPLLLLACVLVLQTRVAWLRAKWIIVGAAVCCSLVLFMFLTWGDAAGWYRWSNGDTQTGGTHVTVPEAPLGSGAIMLEATAQAPSRQLINPLPREALGRISGQTVTVGGWVWADQPAAHPSIGVRYTTWNNRVPVDVTSVLTVTATPTFVTQTFEIPTQLRSLSYVFYANAPAGSTGIRVYLDGALLVPETFPDSTQPEFADVEGMRGTWNGREFENVLRNGSGEREWPRLQPWLEHTIYRYIHRSPAQVVAALFDIRRVGLSILTDVLPVTFDSFAGWFGWGGVRMQHPLWVFGSRVFGAFVLGAAILWMLRYRRTHNRLLYAALLFLGCAGALAWMNTVLRPLPLLGESDAAPIGRYSFPAIIPSVLLLAGGLWALVPKAHRTAAMLVLLAGLVVVNAVALTMIRNMFI